MKTLVYCRTNISEKSKNADIRLEKQKKDCEKYAADNGIDITVNVQEKGESGMRKNIQAGKIKALLRLLNKRNIEMLLVSDFKVISRDNLTVIKIIKMANENGIQVVAVNAGDIDMSAVELFEKSFEPKRVEL